MDMPRVEAELERDMARVKNHRAECARKLQRNTTQAVLLRNKLVEMERQALIIEAEMDRDDGLLLEYKQKEEEISGRRGPPKIRPAMRMEMDLQ